MSTVTAEELLMEFNKMETSEQFKFLESANIRAYHTPSVQTKEMDDYEFNLKRGWKEPKTDFDGNEESGTIKHFQDYQDY